jgi:hypothetical protein
MRYRGGIALAAVLVVVLGLGLFWMLDSGRIGRPLLWRFPRNYQGWVIMQFNRAQCSSLGKDGIYLVIPILPSGYGCTLNPIPEGWRYTRYVYEDSAGERELRAAGWNSNSSVWPFAVNRKKNEWYVFVGTQDAFRLAMQHAPH